MDLRPFCPIKTKKLSSGGAADLICAATAGREEVREKLPTCRYEAELRVVATDVFILK